MYSVKLTRISIPSSSIPTSNALKTPDNQGNTFSIKVKYKRERSPTQDNPLDGLFDYSQLGRALENTLPVFDLDRSVVDLEKVLVSELQRQGIHCGKYKLLTKLESEVRIASPKEKEFRINGFVEDVVINHGHFLDNQKLSATGNSIESLKWVIKLGCSDQEVSAKFQSAFYNQTFQDEVAAIIRDGLSRGDALELVNEAIKKLVQKKFEQLDSSPNKIVFLLKRRGVLKSALVVIGETHTVGAQPLKFSDRARKYHDFYFLENALKV